MRYHKIINGPDDGRNIIRLVLNIHNFVDFAKNYVRIWTYYISV